jgi:hypothetical protein
MATKIILTIDETLDTNEQHKLRNLLCDAFSEFATRRSPAEQYVEERYPAGENYDWLNRSEKVKEVNTRIARAKQLHSATFEATFVPQHVNHAVCVVAKKPCSPTCYAAGEQTLREIDDEVAASGARAQARLSLLQEMFGMTEEEARAAYNQLEDKRISKLMVKQGQVKS